jgi:magnesium chelatase accessory protein
VSRAADFEREGPDWPNRSASRFVTAAGLRWHVQVAGDGPVVLLLHGTGAATHSWAGLLPLLAEDFTVVAPDLPGHGFTEAAPRRQLSLAGMGEGVAALLDELGTCPVLGVGHSAGAAILIRMALDDRLNLRGIVSLNGALMPSRGMPGPVSSAMAKLLFMNPVAPWLFARRAGDRKVVERMMRGTGSAISPEGLDLYARLARRSDHVAAALGMMASWDLKTLTRDLPALEPPLLLVVGTNDRMVPPSQATRLRRLLPGAAIAPLPGLGHLAHEERPADVRALITRFARSVALRPS